MATPVEISFRVVGADQVAGALQQMENRARQMSSAMTSTMAPARQGIAALSSSLSGAASIARLAGDAGQEFGRKLETATIVIFAATTAVQALRGATLAWAGAVVIANTALVSLATIAATLTAAVLAAPFAAAALVAGGLVTTLVLLKPELLGFKTAVAEISAEVDLAVVRAAAWVKAWSNLDTAFQLVRESAFALHLEIRGLLGVTDELAGKWRVGITKITTEQAKESERLAETARREAAAHQKLTDAIREARMQRELDLIVQTITAERARDIENSLRRQAEFLREAAQAAAERFRLEQETADLIRLANEQAIQAIEDAQRERLEETRRILAEIARLEQETADLIRIANQQAIEAIEEEERERFRVGQELLVAFAARAKALKETIGQAFSGLFSDILSGARSFGDALSNFFRTIANIILQHFILKIILPFLGLQRGGIVAGGLIPLFAAQAGGIVSRPTLALMGEGRQSEAVVPLPDNRSIPVKFIGQAAGPREAVIHLTIHNVIGDPRALGIMTAGDVAGVIVNDVARRGPTFQTIRVALA